MKLKRKISKTTENDCRISKSKLLFFLIKLIYFFMKISRSWIASCQEDANKNTAILHYVNDLPRELISLSKTADDT